MSYDRPTSKDVEHIFAQYEELVKEYGLIRPGYNLSLDIGSKTYGCAYRVYEVADRSLWGQKEDEWQQYGSGQYEPTIGGSFLGMAAREAWDNLAGRKRVIYDIVRALKLNKVEQWVNNESEGTNCSVGPFHDIEDANMFRTMMFADPEYGMVSTLATGQKMSVREYQEAFRADFVGETRPPAHWGAI